MKIRFEGAARTVTGSRTLLIQGEDHFQVDCGLYQGPKPMRLLNWEKPQDVEKVRAMVISHAHIDHSGLLPRWTSWGWRGKIYCTTATADLLSILLLDAARLQEEDARFANQTKYSHHTPALPLYTEEDAKEVLTCLVPLPYEVWQDLGPKLSFRFLQAGHILGSALVQFRSVESNQLLTFSGDLGGGHSDLLPDPKQILETDYLILESTYGDRISRMAGREDRLAQIVERVIKRGGTLVIPAFALGRSQDLLFSLFRLREQKKIPRVPIYLDSPMANAVTGVYRKNISQLRSGEANSKIFESLSTSFFHGVESPDDSMFLTLSEEPKIVISASGMLQGGRILHHLKQKLPKEKNGVLFVGYQGEGTKGRLLLEGIGSLRIHHQETPVEAEIFSLEGYSAHADQGDLLRWVSGIHQKLKKIYLNHGEWKGQQVLAEKLAELGFSVEVPELHQEYDLDGFGKMG